MQPFSKCPRCGFLDVRRTSCLCGYRVDDHKPSVPVPNNRPVARASGLTSSLTASSGVPLTNNRPAARGSLLWPVLSWGMFGGVVAVPIAAVLIFIFVWVTGTGFNPAGLPHSGPPLTGMQAVEDAFYMALIFGILIGGLPVFVLGAIVGGRIRWARSSSAPGTSHLSDPETA